MAQSGGKATRVTPDNSGRYCRGCRVGYFVQRQAAGRGAGLVIEHVDPDRVETKEDLAHELTSLRMAVGLTVRDLARRIDSPLATVGDYFAGRHLPGTRQLPVFKAILAACRVTEEEEVERWLAALGRARLATDGRAAKGPSPYRGLDAFTGADADLFFGRRRVVEELLGCIRTHRNAAPGTGAAAVVGPSGSGKTSLLMAGLLPAVRRGALDTETARWEVTVVTADRLGAPAPGDLVSTPLRRQLVIVDQVEAVLSLPPQERSSVLRGLAGLQRSAFTVIGLRADFYQAAISEPALVDALRNQVILGPMTADELRDAVVGPVRHVGAGIEEGLVDLILSDLAPGSPPGYAHEAGALPLLSYALLAAWSRSTRNQIGIAEYRAAGGLRGAVHQAAEAVYESLPAPERDETRRLFSRLVRVDDDTPPTRRRVRRTELVSGPSGPDGDLERILERFLEARLLTADAENVQISHEALLGAWPRLSSWIESDRDWLRLRHQISEAARSWSASERDGSLLWRGNRLQAAVELAGGLGRAQDLNQEESEFLAGSVQSQREEERLRRRRTRRVHQLLGVVSLLGAVAVVLAVITANADFSAQHARDQALSRQVAVEAQQLAATDPSLSAQLALAAYRISPTVQARSVLLDATAGDIPARLLGPVGPQAVSVSAQASLLAVAQASRDTVALYRLSSGLPVRETTVSAGPASQDDYAVALSPDGRELAAAGTTGKVSLWSVSNPAQPTSLAVIEGVPGTVFSLQFSPNGRSLAVADSNGTVLRWDLTVPAVPRAQSALAMPGHHSAKAVAFSPDGTTIAAAGIAGALAEWNVATGQGHVATGTGGSDYETIAYSPLGRQFAVGSGNLQSVEVWQLTAGGLRRVAGPLHVATSEIDSVAYSPDGAVLAVSSAAGTVHLYSTGTWKEITSFGDPDPVTSIAFGSGGHTLVTADSGGVTRIWPLPLSDTYTQPGNVYSITYSGNGQLMTSSSAGTTGGVTLWRTTDPLRPARLVDFGLPAGFGASGGTAAITPDGRYLAAADEKAHIQLFDLADPAHPVPVGVPLTGNQPYIEQLGFSPNGRLLLASDDSGQVRLWDVQNPAEPKALPPIRSGSGEILGFAMTPDGTTLATASSDSKVRLFNIADPSRPRLLATLGGFTDYAYDATISPDGRILVAGSADGSIRIWDISDPARPRLLGRPITGLTGYVFQVAVSPDGQTLAAATTAHTVWLWNIAHPAHPRLLAALSAARDEVFVVRFNPDGRVLAASGSDNTLHFWDYQANDAARQVCQSAGTAITRAEWNHYIQGAGYRPPC